MTLTDMYYELHYGSYPFEDYDFYDKTSAIINHLKDDNFSTATISEMIQSSKKDKNLKLENIDSSFWEDSLTKIDKFYYHSELRIQSARPKWDPVTNQIKKEDYFLEMRTNYTMNDLLHYFYINSNMNIGLRDYKRDSGGLKFLLKSYSVFDGIENIDFLLHLIDVCSQNNTRILSPMDLRENEHYVLEYMDKITKEAELYDVNKIVWRRR